MTEHIESAIHTAKFTVDSLRDALKLATAVEASMILLPMIEAQVAILRDLERWHGARAEDANADAVTLVRRAAHRS